jgi:hypothetical protein
MVLWNTDNGNLDIDWSNTIKEHIRKNIVIEKSNALRITGVFTLRAKAPCPLFA